MTKSAKVIKPAVAKGKVQAINVLPRGTVVVHNYGEFTHGVILEHVADKQYRVYFSDDMSPMLPKYQANTDEAIKARVRTITVGKGFFVSRFKSIEEVREAQRKYKDRGLNLENAA